MQLRLADFEGEPCGPGFPHRGALLAQVLPKRRLHVCGLAYKNPALCVRQRVDPGLPWSILPDGGQGERIAAVLANESHVEFASYSRGCGLTNAAGPGP